MPGPYSSYITAIQAIYDGLTAANFPGGVLTPGPFLDEAPQTSSSGGRQSPPYVVMEDTGSTEEWTFGKGDTPDVGQNAIVKSSFSFEAFAFSLGDCDNIIKAILWNGSNPNARAGVAFATLSLVSPQKGVAAAVWPKRVKRGYAGFQYNNQRVHSTKQWFDVLTAISGDGL